MANDDGGPGIRSTTSTATQLPETALGSRPPGGGDAPADRRRRDGRVRRRATRRRCRAAAWPSPIRARDGLLQRRRTCPSTTTSPSSSASVTAGTARSRARPGRTACTRSPAAPTAAATTSTKRPPLYDQQSFVRHLDAAGVSWRWYSYDIGTLRCVDDAVPARASRPLRLRREAQAARSRRARGGAVRRRGRSELPRGRGAGQLAGGLVDRSELQGPEPRRQPLQRRPSAL